MQIVETCPKCGAELLGISIATYPPIPAKQCPRCGWYWEGSMEEIKYVPFKEPSKEEPSPLEKVADVLHEHFCMPCDLCKQYFKCDDCPKEIETCNDKRHWRMLLERIAK